jgi:hypothetical protein
MMEQLTILEIINQFFGGYASVYLVPVAALVAAVMEWYKRKNKVEKWLKKKFTPYIGLGVSIFAAVVLFFIEDMSFIALLINWAGIYFAEIAVDAGLIKPIMDIKK